MPRIQNPGVGAGQTALGFTTTIVSAAQLVTLGTTPVTLVPPPGVNKVNIVLLCAFNYIQSSHTFNTTGVDQLDVYYQSSAIDLVQPGLLGGFITGVGGGGGLVVTVPPLSGVYSPVTPNYSVQLNGPNYDAGPIATSSLGAGGLGYAVNDVGTISVDSNDAAYKVTGIGAGGAVTSFTLTSNGTSYIAGNGYATTATSGPGNGLTINVLTVTQGNGTLKVYTLYQVVPSN